MITRVQMSVAAAALALTVATGAVVSIDAAGGAMSTMAVAAATTTPTAWPQVQNGPSHTGFTPETIGATASVIWTHPFQPETVNPQVQPILNNGLVFAGTEGGHVYALDAATGAQKWLFPTSGAIGPIENSVAAADNRVFVPSMDGALYALDATTGAQVWKAQVSPRQGLSTAAVLDDNSAPTRVLVASRDGTLVSVSPTDGSIQWKYSAGAPVLQTPAYDSGRAFVASMDMTVAAVNTANGTLAWKSHKLSGIAFKDYWPVVTQGKVVIRSMAATALMAGGTSYSGIPVDNYADATQTTALAAYDAHASQYSLSLHVLDEATGAELPGVVHWNWEVTMHGASPAPCVDKDGYLIIPAAKPDNLPNSWKGGWARLNLATRKLVEGLTDSANVEAGYGNRDENMAPTCTANGVVVMHSEEGNAQYTGFFNLSTHTWTSFWPGMKDRRLSTNNQGGGTNPVSILSGRMYHIAWHELVARAMN